MNITTAGPLGFRFWYFVFAFNTNRYQHKEAVAIAQPNLLAFDLTTITMELYRKYKTACIIESWTEISYTQYVRFNQFIISLEKPKDKNVFTLMKGGKNDEPPETPSAS